MSTRVRWIVVGLALLVVVGLVGIYWFNTNLTMSTVETRAPKTWIVFAGETRTLSPDEVRPDDRFGCGGPPVKAPRVAFSQSVPWGTVRTAGDGSVTVSCYEGDIAST
jgi:hypothetical protein